MRLWALVLLVGIGTIFLGVIALLWTTIANTTFFTDLGLTGWERAIALLGPLVGLLLLFYTGYQILTSGKKEE